MSQAFLDRQRQRLEQNLDAEFYDITAWSLPLAYNLRTWVAARATWRSERRRSPRRPAASRARATSAGWCRRRGSPPTALAAALQKRRVHFRVALAAFTGGERRAIPSGTLFIPRARQPGSLREILAALLQEDGLTRPGLASSYEIKGLSLGSTTCPRCARCGWAC